MIGSVLVGHAQTAAEPRRLEGIVTERVIAAPGKNGFAGTFLDPAGAVIPGVTIELRSAETLLQTAQSDGEGRFRIEAVQAAEQYELRFAVQGFKTLVIKNLGLKSSELVELRVVLEPYDYGKHHPLVAGPDELVEAEPTVPTATFTPRTMTNLPRSSRILLSRPVRAPGKVNMSN